MEKLKVMKNHSSPPLFGGGREGAIDLHLPTSWQSCTASDLEKIVASGGLPIAPPKGGLGGLPHSPNDSEAALLNPASKVTCFLALTGLELLGGPDTSLPLEEQTIEVAMPLDRRWWQWWKPRRKIFTLALWQVHYWIKEQLSWLDNPPAIPRFPYPVWKYNGREFHGPKTYLSDWSWGQYRLAQDYLSYYFKVIGGLGDNRNNDITSLRNNAKKIAEATAMFLATIYNGRVVTLDPDTHQPKEDYAWVSDQSTANMEAFMDFPPLRMQVILLWWGTTMERLHRVYPKCFKSSDKHKKKPRRTQDPMEEYAKLTAALEHYTHFDEATINREQHEVILQRLTQMITENEEVEKIRAKHK